MIEKVLSYPIYDIETAVSSGHAIEVHEETEKLMRFIFDSATGGKISPEILDTFIVPQKNAIIASSLKEHRNQQIMFAFGRFTGAVEVLEKFLDFIIKQEQSKKE